jgi:uncharacterized protein
MNIKTILFFVSILIPLITLGASFDCNNVTRAAEKIICSDQELSDLDEKINKSYRNALTKNPDTKFSQRDWLRDVNQCNQAPDPVRCFKDVYKDRLKLLNHIANPNVGIMGVELIGPYKINDQNGMQVKSVAPNGPGDKSGIVSGDFIVEINNVKINDIDQVINQSSVPAGQSVLLKIIKANNSERIIHITMAEKFNALETANNEVQIEVENKSTTTNEIDNNHATSPLTNQDISKADYKDTPDQDDKNIDSNSSKGLWIILLIIISGFGIYYLKQQKTQNLLAVPKKNKNQPKENAVTKKVESQKQKKEMSREDILKQQQINAFKKIK